MLFYAISEEVQEKQRRSVTSVYSRCLPPSSSSPLFDDKRETLSESHGDIRPPRPVFQFSSLTWASCGPTVPLPCYLLRLHLRGGQEGSSRTKTTSTTWKPAAAGPQETLQDLTGGGVSSLTFVVHVNECFDSISLFKAFQEIWIGLHHLYGSQKSGGSGWIPGRDGGTCQQRRAVW